MTKLRLIAMGLLLAAFAAGCTTFCSYVPIPGVCSSSPTDTPTATIVPTAVPTAT